MESQGGNLTFVLCIILIHLFLPLIVIEYLLGAGLHRAPVCAGPGVQWERQKVKEAIK